MTADDRVVRVLPDEAGVGKAFDYVLPASLGGEHVRVGTRVRVPLGPRRVGGWVVADDVSPVPGVTLREVAKLSGHGPPAELIELAHWAAWRWAGRPATFLRTASPPRVVRSLPAPSPWVARRPDWSPGAPHELVRRGLALGRSVVRLPPAANPALAALVAAWEGPVLVVCPTGAMARRVVEVLRGEGQPVVLHPDGWAAGAAGGVSVVGTRAAAWAPVAGMATAVVLDEHDESLAQEAVPTWNARDVVAERAARAGVPCVVVSPCPSLEAQGWGELVTPNRSDERRGWPVVEVVDRREDDPRTGLLSERLVAVARAVSGRVVCVLNRAGRAKLLACSACGELATCEVCHAAVGLPGDDATLACARCGATRPSLCLACGATRLKLLRPGVSRVREELEALLGEPVGEVTGARPAAGGEAVGDGSVRERVLVGTEAVLHQVERCDVVAFLDLDQELLAPRYRAVEQALALVVRAARLLDGRGRASAGRLVLQTRLPTHEVVEAAVQGDPGRVSVAEAERRGLLRFPPEAALAEVSGAGAEMLAGALRGVPEVEVMGPADGRWLVRASEHRVLCDALASVPRPKGRVRVSVDPLRV